jgi:hypothetical protein
MKITTPIRFIVLTGLLGVAAKAVAAEEPVASAEPPPASASASGSGKPEFRGILTTSKERRFLLSTPGAAHSDWSTIGDSFQEWKLADYDEATGTLLLQKPGGPELKLTLAGNHIAGADVKATIADAQRVLSKMHFNEMIDKMLEQQRRAIAQMMAQQRKGKLPPGTTPEEMAAFQQKVLDKLMSGIKGSDLQQDVATIYTNVFTPDELNGLADFYDTSTGQMLIAKQPLVQQQMMQTMMPRIMAMQPEIQQMQQEFSAQHTAAAPTPSPAPGTGAPPTP